MSSRDWEGWETWKAGNFGISKLYSSPDKLNDYNLVRLHSSHTLWPNVHQLLKQTADYIDRSDVMIYRIAGNFRGSKYSWFSSI